jgi:hypothetical protein
MSVWPYQSKNGTELVALHIPISEGVHGALNLIGNRFLVTRRSRRAY